MVSDKLETAPRQLQFKHFPKVGDKSVLYGVREWVGPYPRYFDDTFSLRTRTPGTTSPAVLKAFLRAHPYIHAVTFSRVHLDKTSAPKRRRTIRASRVTEERLAALSRNMAPVPGWNSSHTGFGLLSRMRMDERTIVHIPMMKFWEDDPIKVAERMAPYFPGVVIADSVGIFSSVLQFWSLDAMTYNAWVNFLVFCRKNIRGADKDFIDRSITDGTSVLRILPHPPYKPIAPQVVALAA